MSLAPTRGLVLAFAIAAGMHLMLFVLAQPSVGRGQPVALVPPVTRYGDSTVAEGDSDNVRMIESPVLFSLPSPLGFSRELMDHDVVTRKSFMQQQVHSEQFLDVSPSAQNAVERIQPGELMVAATSRDPLLPVPGAIESAPFPPARRVTMSWGLRDRLIGGIVLPPGLNKIFEKPWAVHASASISEQGQVVHVFLDQPLEPASLNQEVLRLLYGLRFKPGKAVDGTIDIYSPETAAGGAVK